VLGVWKSEGVPRTQESRTSARKSWRGDKESLKACTRLKSCESLYTCPHAPFYREMKRLLHSEITLESREYSSCEHIQECTLHPVICGANFIHYKSATSSHFKPGVLKRRLWLGFFLTPEAFIHENHRLLWFVNRYSTRFTNFADSWFSELRQFPIMLKRIADLRTEAYFGYYFRILLEGQQNVWNSSGFFHECFLLTKRNFPPWRWFTNLFANSVDPTFRGWKVFARFATSSGNKNFSWVVSWVEI
jgi:hypothetical protein